MADKTNYMQSLMHMIKGNLGAGILAMPASFKHAGLYSSIVGLPVLCIISTYCVHLLVKSSQHIESKRKGLSFQYASLAKYSFESGPKCTRKYSESISRSVDIVLLMTQIGVCCVYIVFVVDNVSSILSTYNIVTPKSLVFIAVFPVMLLLGFIRTLNRLAIASTIANLLQAVGLSLILEYLIRDVDKIDFSERDKFRPISETALGFGSAMFAFEGISVVLPIYSRMKNQDRMSGLCGVINVSYVANLILYFVVGLFGYLKFGRNVRDSITLNLPAEPLYDVVRGMFVSSIVLTYPLQLYVPNEIIWNWCKSNPLTAPNITPARALEVVVPNLNVGEKSNGVKNNETIPVADDGRVKAKLSDKTIEPPVSQQQRPDMMKHEYYCRTLIVLVTFFMAFSIPKLNLLMDFVGSLSGTILSLTLPAVIHLVVFWDSKRGCNKATMILIDFLIIAFSLIAGGTGSAISLMSILRLFK